MKFGWDGLENNEMETCPESLYPASGRESDINQQRPTVIAIAIVIAVDITIAKAIGVEVESPLPSELKS